MFLSDYQSKKLLLKHINLEEDLLYLFTQEEIDKDELHETLKDINALNKDKYELNLESVTTEKYIPDKTLVKSYFNCLDEIKSVCNTLNKKEIPTLNLNKVICFLELFSKNILDTQIEINNLVKQEGNIIILSEKEESFPLLLKNGKKIILTNSNFDFSSFCYDELIELLRLLDIVISDNKYDNLRCEITKHISSISSVSLVREK